MATSRLLAVVATAIGLALGACGPSTVDQVGPGSNVGPQGSVGPIGDEVGVPGSGNVTTETRAVGSFDRVVFESEGSVVLTQTGRASLSVTADDNLQELIDVVVDKSELTISTAVGADIAPTEPIVFQIEVVSLTAIELRGAGSVMIETLEASSTELTLTGTGDIAVADLRADELRVDLRGTGDIVLSGTTDGQIASVSGVGEYDAAELVTRIAQVEVLGLGKATVWVTDELSITASESGSVAFYGAPDVTQQVSDSGTVTPLGDR